MPPLDGGPPPDGDLTVRSPPTSRKHFREVDASSRPLSPQTVRGSALTVRWARLTVRLGHLTVRWAHLTVRWAHLTVRWGPSHGEAKLLSP